MQHNWADDSRSIWSTSRNELRQHLCFGALFSFAVCWEVVCSSITANVVAKQLYLFELPPPSSFSFFTSNFLFHNTLWTRVWKRCPADVMPDSFCNLCIALLILHLLCNSCFVKRRRQHLCLLYSWWIVCLLRTLQKSLKEGAWYRVQLRFCCALAVNRICCTSGQK